jgi:leucyl/phenylalanyl-tRNA--protein transferase
MLFRLLDDKPNIFPDPHFGEEDGLIAIGGDLSPERLITAYNNGIFPWYGYKENEEIMWWCPLDRFVIFPEEIHISHSMLQLIKKGTYKTTINQAFEKVIENCSKTDKRNEQVGAWLGDDMINAYKKMYELGLAASIEVWDKDGNLVGGLYGININNNFFGESMFSLVPNASKLALIYLAEQLKPFGGIIDCQFETAHLLSMGGKHITYDEYMKYLRA